MRHVRGVSITPDSVDITFMDDASDLRAEGLVYQMHTLTISRLEEDLEEEMDDLQTAVDALLAAGLRRWATTPPVSPEQIMDRMLSNQTIEDDEDEDEGEGEE